MKIRVLLIAVVLFAASACTQKTCPTYAKKDVKDVKTEKQDKVRL
ncbi:MAG: hypothetical protein NXI20_19245 [bacterium]|jgi:hypothetical protein|nr:hypothetical protein [bacterium]